MHAVCLSTMLCGVTLGMRLRSSSVCVSGFAALQVIHWWVLLCFRWVLPCLTKVDTTKHADLNDAVLLSSTYNADPTVQRASAKRSPYSACIAIVSGTLSALSLTLPAQWGTGDVHVLAMVIVVLLRHHYYGFKVSILFFLLVWLTAPTPSAHGIVRGITTCAAVFLNAAQLPSRWCALRIATAIVVAALSAGDSKCTSVIGALSPAFFLSTVLYNMHLSPTYVLALAIITKIA